MLTFEGQKLMGSQQVRCPPPLASATSLETGPALPLPTCTALLLAKPFNQITWSEHFVKTCFSISLQIIQKLTSLPFQKCQHRISSLDAQPSIGGGILVFVTGQLLASSSLFPFFFITVPCTACVGALFRSQYVLKRFELYSSFPHLQPDGESNPLKFSQTFHLMPVGSSFVVTNGKPGLYLSGEA
jgi:hypothetical protein